MFSQEHEMTVTLNSQVDLILFLSMCDALYGELDSNPDLFHVACVSEGEHALLISFETVGMDDREAVVNSVGRSLRNAGFAVGSDAVTISLVTA